ncbi:MAG: HugZ family protein [Rubrimonas sp.]|uniref:HugZ family pyridoxamine 5'-phosphate oxidase n=1 Tax=Rubrimonas sp. TaxID=2036015 RepID=UPI002FDD1F70
MIERDDALRPVDDAARAQAKRMIRTARFAALATAAPGDGWPSASRVALATLIEGAPVFLASGLSVHSDALAAEPRCSLLIGEPGKGDPLAHPRLTLFARAEKLAREADADARRRYLARHPKAGLYADFGDFSFWRCEIARADFNAGFGKAYALEAADLAPRVDWSRLAEAEARMVAHMNADHAESVRHFARICGGEDGAWTLTGVDPEGADLACGDAVRRLEFMTPVADGNALRAALVALARRAV